MQEILADALTRIVARAATRRSSSARSNACGQLAEAAGEEFEDDEDKPFAELKKEAGEFKKELDGAGEALPEPVRTKGITGGVKVWSELSRAAGYVGSTKDAPSPAVLRHLEAAEGLAAASVDP